MSEATEKKTLDNQNIAQAAAAIPDLKVFGNGDTWRLICKASSDVQGWMKSTKAMPVEGLGVMVQVSTQQFDYEGLSSVVAEAIHFVPGAVIDLTDPKTPLVRGAAMRKREKPPEVLRELAGSVIEAGREPAYA